MGGIKLEEKDKAYKGEYDVYTGHYLQPMYGEGNIATDRRFLTALAPQGLGRIGVS